MGESGTKDILFAPSQLHVLQQAPEHTTRIEWIDGTVPTTCTTSSPPGCLSRNDIHPPSLGPSHSLWVCLGCCRLGLGGSYWEKTWRCSRWRRRLRLSDGSCQRETLVCPFECVPSIACYGDSVTPPPRCEIGTDIKTLG